MIPSRRRIVAWSAATMAAVVLTASAQTIHVATNGSHTAPFDTWARAATNLAVAIDLANGTGHDVLVDDGVYTLSATSLVVSAAYTLASVNGADTATIERHADAPDFAVVQVLADALITGFTIRGGKAATDGWMNAGDPTGIWITNGIVSNCVVTANWGGMGVKIEQRGLVTHSLIVSNTTYGAASVAGGGILQDSTVAYQVNRVWPGTVIYAGGIVRRCRIHNNSGNGWGPSGVLFQGAGRLENTLIYDNYAPGYPAVSLQNNGIVEHCTISRNTGTSALGGNGVHRAGGTMRNSIVFDNVSTAGATNPDYRGDVTNAVYASCSPDLIHGFQGNIADDPMFVDGAALDFRLRPGSRCIDMGTNAVTVVDDIDGTPRPQVGGTRGGLFHDMGAYEMDGTSGALAVGFYGDPPRSGFAPLTVTFRANVMGADTDVSWYGWDFNNDGDYDLSGAGLGTVSTNFDAGLYSVRVAVSNTAMETAMSTNLNYIAVVDTNLYVATNGTHTAPFDTWARAATNVHAALDLAIGGCTIHIGNGVFPTTREIVIADDIRILGSGRDDTLLERVAAAGNFRIMSLGHPDAMVAGLTLRNGYSGTAYGIVHGLNLSSGMASNIAVTGCSTVPNSGRAVSIANALMTGSSITNNGGSGVLLGANGRLIASLVARNGGTSGTTISPVAITGAGALMDRCRVISNICYNGYNTCTMSISAGTLRNTLVQGNHAPNHTGGILVSGGTVEHCTIADNFSLRSGIGIGMHQTGGVVRNCIIHANRGSPPGDYTATGGSIVHSLAPELTHGANGNLASDPMFADADYRLQPGSPCIDAGTNLVDVVHDIEGHPRPRVGGTRGGLVHDMGIHEMDGTSGDFAVGFYGDPPLSGIAPLTVTFHANAVGANTNVTWYGWDFNNDGLYEQAGPGLATLSHAFGAGVYSVRLAVSNDAGMAAVSTNLNMVSVVGSNLYVATDGLHQFPFDTWLKAATNLHDAVDAAVAGSTVHVGDGTFTTTNTVSVATFRLTSANGPDASEIALDSAAFTRLYPVIHVENIGSVSGFTLRGGKVPGGWPDGGTPTGARIMGGMVSNCIIRGNVGGTGVRIENGLVTHTRIISNNNYIVTSVAAGGILEDSQVAYQTVSGPYELNIAGGGIVRRCQIHHNTVNPGWDGAWNNIGGAGSRIENSLVYANRSLRASHAAGLIVAGGDVLNCTIVANTNAAGSPVGAGVHQTGGTIINTIIHGNSGSAGDYSATGGTIGYSLAAELTPGEDGNLAEDPLFFKPDASDFRLMRGSSSCIDAGLDQPWMDTATDLQGLPRVLQGRPPAAARVDMGAYETLPPLGGLVTIR